MDSARPIEPDIRCLDPPRGRGDLKGGRPLRCGLSSKFIDHLFISVDVPERGHGDDGVPERFGNAGEGGGRLALLRVEHDRCEHDDRHRQREQQETELAGARLERVAEDPQTQWAKELINSRGSELARLTGSRSRPVW